MKADIHPNYRDVVFHDVTSDFKILTRSTMATKETIQWEDGNEYPLVKVEISRLRTRSTRASTRSSTPRAVSTSSRSATRADLSIQLNRRRALRGRLFFPNANPTGV